jgi:DMSO/TMAO reductase YedYZ molybdopterin-dependent catalytic subunit
MNRTRREFLRRASAAAGTLLIPRAGVVCQGRDFSGGRLLATLPLDDSAGRRVPLETLLGTALDARMFTDLATLTPETLVTATDRFFVRTAGPGESAWSLSVGGLVRQPQTLTLDALGRDVRPAGVHLLECSGNSAPTFGLMSAARWEGIPVLSVLDRAQPLARASRVLVSGVDDLATPSRTSIPGASWIFAREDLERAGAFLATRMNGTPLPADHGSPVRLVVPGWYGCVCIKWVNRVELVGDDASATSQMREFAARTHQNGLPALAGEFTPAIIDHAAMPVRVEKWSVNGGIVYRVVGIVWGGSKPTNALVIRFKANQPFVRVSDCPLPASTTTWSLWSHAWRPETPGRYQIVLRIDEPAVRTRRLDLYFYAREVVIDEVASH